MQRRAHRLPIDRSFEARVLPAQHRAAQLLRKLQYNSITVYVCGADRNLITAYSIIIYRYNVYAVVVIVIVVVVIVVMVIGIVKVVVAAVAFASVVSAHINYNFSQTNKQDTVSLPVYVCTTCASMPSPVSAMPICLCLSVCLGFRPASQ
jgi:hypothetical protein